MTLTDSPMVGNGHRPSHPDWAEVNSQHESAVDGLVGELEQQRQAEQQTIAMIELSLIGYRERERKLTRAIAALRGESLAGTKPIGPAKPARPQRKGGYASTEKLEAVYGVIKQLGQARVREIRERVACSEPTVRKALDLLRADERIRIVSSDPKRGVTYALMPGDEETQRAT